MRELPKEELMKSIHASKLNYRAAAHPISVAWPPERRRPAYIAVFFSLSGVYKNK